MLEQLCYVACIFKESLGNSTCESFIAISNANKKRLSICHTAWHISQCLHTAPHTAKRHNSDKASWLTQGLLWGVEEAGRAGGWLLLSQALLRVKAAVFLVWALLNSPPLFAFSLLVCLRHFCSSIIKPMCQRGAAAWGISPQVSLLKINWTSKEFLAVLSLNINDPPRHKQRRIFSSMLQTKA